MRVSATQRGYDNIVVREVGEEFDMPDGASDVWFTPVVEVQPVEAPKTAKAKAAKVEVQLEGDLA